MLRKLLLVLTLVSLAFVILFISVFRSAAVQYDFPLQETLIISKNENPVEYGFPNPGKVLPDSPWWSIKVIRDQLWLASTSNPEREAELLLLFADKRLVSSIKLLEKGKTELAISTLSKAEKYLERAFLKEEENRKAGREVKEFLTTLATASLKHAEIIDAMSESVTGDLQAALVSSASYPKVIYQGVRVAMAEEGMEPPENPYNW